ncbi:hypothetical protein LOAG_00245 [Loa loa]|uniref:Uncharacterized protein n=1 Tax=Loa loa TaxID=7209 RepID=A0A1S0UDU1_LOALO|nr:hypothetical protein LOAG_00245 [Loa loa]EFO28250.1 hypothetical protein LOAG_00245 [Loa loa]
MNGTVEQCVFSGTQRDHRIRSQKEKKEINYVTPVESCKVRNEKKTYTTTLGPFGHWRRALLDGGDDWTSPCIIYLLEKVDDISRRTTPSEPPSEVGQASLHAISSHHTLLEFLPPLQSKDIRAAEVKISCSD